MVWKNLKQRSLADSMLVDHEALKELDGVRDEKRETRETGQAFTYSISTRTPTLCP